MKSALCAAFWRGPDSDRERRQLRRAPLNRRFIPLLFSGDVLVEPKQRRPKPLLLACEPIVQTFEIRRRCQKREVAERVFQLIAPFNAGKLGNIS